MPTGKAEKVDGGYRFSGRWSWSSGVEHCEWIFLGGLLPKKDGSGQLEHCTFLLPKKDYQVVHNFDVLGLRATASHDIVVEAYSPLTKASRLLHPVVAAVAARARVRVRAPRGGWVGATARPSARRARSLRGARARRG